VDLEQPKQTTTFGVHAVDNILFVYLCQSVSIYGMVSQTGFRIRP